MVAKSDLTQTEANARLSFKKIDEAASITKAALKYGTIIVCVYYAFRSIAVLAGKQTLASIGLSILGNVTVSNGIYIVLTGGSIVYGLGQRQLRRRSIKRLTEQGIKLEQRFDPKRTSSGLTKWGTTKPEDKT